MSEEKLDEEIKEEDLEVKRSKTIDNRTPLVQKTDEKLKSIGRGAGQRRRAVRARRTRRSDQHQHQNRLGHLPRQFASLRQPGNDRQRGRRICRFPQHENRPAETRQNAFRSAAHAPGPAAILRAARRHFEPRHTRDRIESDVIAEARLQVPRSQEGSDQFGVEDQSVAIHRRVGQIRIVSQHRGALLSQIAIARLHPPPY